MKQITLSIALVFSLALALAPSPATAQFRFKSRTGRSTSQSMTKRTLPQQKTTKQTTTKQTTTKNTTPNSRRRSTIVPSTSKTVKQQSSIPSRRSRIQNQLKNQNSRTQKTSKGYQPNGPVTNQPVQTRENWKTGTDILKRQQRGKVNSSRNSGRVKNPAPFDPKALQAAKGKQMGIFPGERGTGKPIDLDRNGNSSRAKGSSRGSSSKNNLADRISGNSNLTKIPTNPRGRGGKIVGNDNLVIGNQGRGKNVNTEADRESGKGRQPGNQDLIDLINGNGRNPGSNNNGKNESENTPGTGGKNPGEPGGRGTDIRDRIDDLLNGGNNSSREPDNNDDDQPTDGNDTQPAPTEGDDPANDDPANDGTGNTNDNENQSPESDEQDTPMEDQQPEVEPEPAEELPPQEDQDYEQENEQENAQEEDKLDKVIDLIKNLPIGSNRPAGPIIIERPIVVTPSERVVVESQGSTQRRIRTDLEVLDIRFVDLGDAESNAGPRFRVFLKNHNNRYSLNNVQVDLVAGTDFNDDDSPRQTVSGVVESIAPRGTASVDIQTSRDVLKMTHPKTGVTAAFSQLAAIADPDSSFEDVKPENNVVSRNLSEVQHVRLKVKKLANNQLKSSTPLTIQGEGFKFESGTVVLVINEKPYALKVTNWAPTQIDVTVPNFVLVNPVDAQLIVVRPDKSFSKPQAVSVSN